MLASHSGRCAAFLLGIVHLLACGSLHAETLTFDTSESPFIPGSDNQGYYKLIEGRPTGNDNYIVGALSQGESWRNFFTFDVTDLPAGQQIVGATLRLRRGFTYGAEGDTHTYNLYDVLTDAETLNETDTINPAIYEDLGSGVLYGSYDVPVDADPESILEFALNSAALTGIMNAPADPSGRRFFSIGGDLVFDPTGNPPPDQALFVGSGGGSAVNGIQQLVLEVAPVPEPSSFALAAMAAVGLIVFRRKLLAR